MQEAVWGVLLRPLSVLEASQTWLQREREHSVPLSLNLTEVLVCAGVWAHLSSDLAGFAILALWATFLLSSMHKGGHTLSPAPVLRQSVQGTLAASHSSPTMVKDGCSRDQARR